MAYGRAHPPTHPPSVPAKARAWSAVMWSAAWERANQAGGRSRSNTAIRTAYLHPYTHTRCAVTGGRRSHRVWLHAGGGFLLMAAPCRARRWGGEGGLSGGCGGVPRTTICTVCQHVSYGLCGSSFRHFCCFVAPRRPTTRASASNAPELVDPWRAANVNYISFVESCAFRGVACV